LRERKRYLVLNTITGAKSLDFKDISAKIRQTALKFLGELGYSKTNLAILNKDNKTMIRTNHDQIDNVRASIALVKEIENQPVILQTIGVTGILKKTNKFEV
jgi:RNase P/RNase MRP subunit POP5